MTMGQQIIITMTLPIPSPPIPSTPAPPPAQKKEENQAFLEHLITIIPASENIFFFFFQIF